MKIQIFEILCNFCVLLFKTFKKEHNSCCGGFFEEIKAIGAEKMHQILTEIDNKTRTSKVGAISKAQKAQNIFFGKKLVIFEKKFFQKKSHSAEKCRRGDPLGLISIHSVAKYEKTRRGDPFETLIIFSKKSLTEPKIL